MKRICLPKIIYWVCILLASQTRVHCLKGPVVTDLVYFDIEIDGEPAGRVIFGLFGRIVPKTAENFLRLAVNDKGYGYTGSRFTHILQSYTIQGGAFRIGNKTGGISWFGAPFDHENYNLKHYGKGWVSMATAGYSGVNSKFQIVTDDLYGFREWYDNRYVVFAAVLHGMKLVHRIESTETVGQLPAKPVLVVASGTLPMKKKFAIAKQNIKKDLVSHSGVKY